MTLWIATGNKGKLAEFKLLLKPLGCEIKAQSELAHFSQPPENGATILDNARIKAAPSKAWRPTAIGFWPTIRASSSTV